MLFRIFRQVFTPTRMIASSFAGMIILGTTLLSLPAATADGTRLEFVNALFVATSATCVTGLSPIDISTKLSGFGQFVILILLQFGGLGLMTLTTTLYFWFGQRLPITSRLAMQESFNTSPNQIRRLVLYVIAFTFSVEFAGALCLFIYWMSVGQFETVGQTAWFSIFHSVSAFTNGGFALFSDNLGGFQKNYIVQLIITTLIILGGIGFLVIYEIKSWLDFRVFRPALAPKFKLSVQSRLTLITTLGIILAGTVVFFLAERERSLVGFTFGEALLNSYTMTILPRTAGFNMLQMTDLSAGTLILVMMLMFIGGSSGSTAGGIKVGTFGILVAYTIARFRGNARLDLWHRSIPQSTIDKASAVVVASAAVILIATMLLMFSETRGLGSIESQTKFVPVFFETVSAYSTVGLSLNFTDKLSDFGKYLVSLVMFLGRVGAITVAVAISLRETTKPFSYAEENIMVG